MSTPGFVPQNSSSLTTVRYYTQFDPYHYAVDNRPLTDLASNITTISSGGGDSARRAVLINELSVAAIFQDLYSNANNSSVMAGLSVSYPSANTIQINPGAVYQLQPTNAVISQTIMQQALLYAPQTFNLVSPSSAGNSITYIIEAQFSDISSANMPTSGLPASFLDSTNTFLPCLLLNKELKLQLKAGTQAPTGTQTPPAVDAGWFALYDIVVTYGVSTPTVYLDSTAPYLKGILHSVSGQALLTNSATQVAVAGVPAWQFAHGSTSGIAVSMPLRSNNTNPYTSIKLRLALSGDTNGGNFAIQLSYLAVGVNSSTATALTNTGIETIAMNVAAGNMQTYSTATAIIPSTAFSGFVNNNWSINCEKLFVTLNRLGGNAADTNTGNLRIHDIVVYQ
jgi:hypothetical protein